MRHYLTGIEARDRGIDELCAEVAPGYRLVVSHTAIPVEDLDACLTENGLFDGSGRPLWIYGSVLPRELCERSTKVQVHETFDAAEAPAWFDHRFARHIREATIPGYSCFSPGSLSDAVRHMLGEYAAVRVKDPNGSSGVGQRTVTAPEEIDATLAAIASETTLGHGLELDDYLAEYGYVVEADLEDVDASSVTLTRTPGGHYSSFGRLRELTVETSDGQVFQNYGGTSTVTVRGDPEALAALPDGGVVVHDPASLDEEVRLAPPPEVLRAAQCDIEGLRLWEAESVYKTRANVDVVTGTVVRRNGERERIAAAVEDSGRTGGASPAELLGILALRADPDLDHVTRSTRHAFDADARTYAAHAATVAGSRVFWNGTDPAWYAKDVFIGVF